MYIKEAKFVCLDTETTGLSFPRGGRICEVALLASQAGKRINSYSTLINPEMYITPEITAIHGITNEMVALAPHFKDIALTLAEHLENSVLICHNVDFDVPFLKYEFENAGLKMPEVTTLDTLKFARTHGCFSRNRLGIIAQELGFSCKGWHRAMADTVMAEKIFYHFLKYFMQSGAQTVEDLVELQTKKIGLKITGDR